MHDKSVYKLTTAFMCACVPLAMPDFLPRITQLSAVVLTARQPFGSNRSNSAKLPTEPSWWLPLSESCDQLSQQMSCCYPFHQKVGVFVCAYLFLTAASMEEKISEVELAWLSAVAGTSCDDLRWGNRYIRSWSLRKVQLQNRLPTCCVLGSINSSFWGAG